jgi:hypothetical protein
VYRIKKLTEVPKTKQKDSRAINDDDDDDNNNNNDNKYAVNSL